jgi:peptide/nickel transport system permease protein
MLTYITRRLAALLFTLVAASVVVFVVLEVLPGDVAQIMLGTEARVDTLAALRSDLGLDRPAAERYVGWLTGLVSGEMGTSYTYRIPVADLVRERLSVTIPLTALSFFLCVAIALPAGFFAAQHHNRISDWGVMATSQLLLAIPNFWFAILIILVFSVWLGWFPAGGFPGWEGGIGRGVKALFLPSIALALGEAAILARVTRGAVLDTLGEDFVRTARAKGLSDTAVMRSHVLRNAFIPIATILGLQFAFLVAGAVIVENVFHLPGIGRLLVQSVHSRDLIVVRDVVVMLTGFVIVVNFLVDSAYALIDPRPRVEL